MAGFGAACAAGRAGLKTLLVERQAQLGGMGTAGGVGNFCYGFGAPIGNGRVFDDVMEAMAAAGAIGEEAGWQVRRSAPLERENHTNDHAVLPLVLQHLAREAGVELLLCTDVVGAAVDRDRITEVVLHNRSLLQAVRAPLFVDATGDAILARHAGARTLVADPVLPQMIKPSLMIFLRRVDGPAPARQPLILRHYRPGEEPDYSVWAEPRGRTSLKFKLHVRYRLRRLRAEEEMLPEAVRHFQEHHDARWVFDFAAPVLGVREGRRIRGDYVLGAADVASSPTAWRTAPSPSTPTTTTKWCRPIRSPTARWWWRGWPTASSPGAASPLTGRRWRRRASWPRVAWRARPWRTPPPSPWAAAPESVTWIAPQSATACSPTPAIRNTCATGWSLATAAVDVPLLRPSRGIPTRHRSPCNAATRSWSRFPRPVSQSCAPQTWIGRLRSFAADRRSRNRSVRKAKRNPCATHLRGLPAPPTPRWSRGRGSSACRCWSRCRCRSSAGRRSGRWRL